jgi:hypothetical protein
MVNPLNAPLVLDFDRSVGALPGATVIDLVTWQEAIRFGCSRRRLHELDMAISVQAPQQYGTVFLGSGDYHHVSWPMIARHAASGPFEVIVFDNHPDNMRFPFGVHCGSWVRRVAALPFVTHVHVVGISSTDVSAGHAWENYLAPLVRGQLTYWTLGVDTRWASRIGLGRAFKSFDSASALLDCFIEERHASTSSAYLSIDKDVLHADVARTNWDQGRLSDIDLFSAIDALAGRIIGSDITGDVSEYRYTTWWKRKLSALDDQPAIDPSQLAAWQAQQHGLNLRLLDRIGAASRDA